MRYGHHGWLAGSVFCFSFEKKGGAFECLRALRCLPPFFLLHSRQNDSHVAACARDTRRVGWPFRRKVRNTLVRGWRLPTGRGSAAELRLLTKLRDPLRSAVARNRFALVPLGADTVQASGYDRPFLMHASGVDEQPRRRTEQIRSGPSGR